MSQAGIAAGESCSGGRNITHPVLTRVPAWCHHGSAASARSWSAARLVPSVRAVVEAIRQTITFPSRAVISALDSRERRKSPEGKGSLARNSEREANDGRRCQASPNCNEFAIEAIARQGLLIGGVKSCWRALRCRHGACALPSTAADQR